MSDEVGYNSTMKKRTLSRRLVQLRKDGGLTAAEACRRLEWSEGKLSYIERAMWIRPNPRDVRDLCELYGLEGEERDALIQLAKDARERGWWRKYNDVLPSELPGLEGGASRIRTFEIMLVPGLLQVPSYSESLTRTKFEDTVEISRRVAARGERRKILVRDDPPAPDYHAVFDEAALLRITDPAIRKEQIEHLLEMGERDNITIQVIPIDRSFYNGIGEVFVVLDFPDPQERGIVFLETYNDERYLEERDELARYIVRFDRLCVDALDPEETSAHLRRRIE